MKDSVQTLLVISLIFLTSIFVITTMVSYEKQIEILEHQIMQDSIQVDSLTLTIDTLQHRLETFDVEHQFNNLKGLIKAIITVESSDNDSAYCAPEDAVGCLQIRKCMVDDVNRILNRKGSTIQYSYDDRWDRSMSVNMFNVYCKHYGLTTAEEISRCWNGGPRGINKSSTLSYWSKVKTELNEINS